MYVTNTSFTNSKMSKSSLLFLFTTYFHVCCFFQFVRAEEAQGNLRGTISHKLEVGSKGWCDWLDMPGTLYSMCDMFCPCNRGLSCNPGFIGVGWQRCYHSPRAYDEPCSVGYPCGDGLSCQPGVHKCRHNPRWHGEDCSAGYMCAAGLECDYEDSICRNNPRQLGEDCSVKDQNCASHLVCGTGGYCMPKFGVGAHCRHSRECLSGQCCLDTLKFCEGGDFNCFWFDCSCGGTDPPTPAPIAPTPAMDAELQELCRREIQKCVDECPGNACACEATDCSRLTHAPTRNEILDEQCRQEIQKCIDECPGNACACEAIDCSRLTHAPTRNMDKYRACEEQERKCTEECPGMACACEYYIINCDY